MAEFTKRPNRQQFASRVRLTVASHEAIYASVATNLSTGGMFVRHDTPPAVGSLVLIEFTLPDGMALCRITARVAHAKTATVPGEAKAGMGLQFIHLDAAARAALHPPPAATPAPPPATTPVTAPMRRPMVSPGGVVIGIDLGTINSCAALVQNGTARVISSHDGYETIPSVVFLGTDGSTVVGHRAAEKMILEPHRAVYGSKRFLGRPYTSREVGAWAHFFNYEIVAGAAGGTAARLGETVVSLEEISGIILRAIKDMASDQLGQPVSRAVITVPAYFGETQRAAVRQAGKLAGLYVERLINEPTAAAIAYGHGRGLACTILVYDLGGGTFDVSLMRVEGNKFEVLAADGDPFLGGSDFDDRITEYGLMTFQRHHDVDLRKDPVAVQRVRFALQLAKHQLSDCETTMVEVPYLAKDPSGGMLDLRFPLERKLLESLTQDLVDRTLALVDKVLAAGGITSEQLDDIVLVGGQSRSPHVRRMVTERFNRKPTSSVHPDQAVALGAALVAHAMQAQRDAVLLVDLLPASIRMALTDGQAAVLLPRGTKLPASKRFEVEASRAEFKVALYRGESRVAVENSFLGVLRHPAGQTSQQGGARLHVMLHVSAEGLLSATMGASADGPAQDSEVSLLDG